MVVVIKNDDFCKIALRFQMSLFATKKKRFYVLKLSLLVSYTNNCHVLVGILLVIFVACFLAFYQRSSGARKLKGEIQIVAF